MTDPYDTDQNINESFDEIFEYFEESLDRPMPDFWRTLAEHAPYAMEGYFQMRQGVIESSGEGHIPRKYKELLVVVMDCAVHNTWGVKAHTRAAIQHGATMEEITEAIVLSILVLGMPNYRNEGYQAMVTAEEMFKENDENHPE